MEQKEVAPWDEITSDERIPDTQTVFIVFCEDSVSEPYYLRSFQHDGLKVNAIPNQRKGKLNLNATVSQCVEDGLMVFNDGYSIKEGITQEIWCVYDRDAENEDLSQVNPHHSTEWDLAIQTAKKAGLQIAWSNDAFELWILLHFEDIAPGNAVHRNFIYERLTAVLKDIKPQTEEFAVITSKDTFYYKHAFKGTYNFITFMLPLLKERTQDAIQRAEKLATHYDNSTPYHNRNPYTLVYQLITKLLAIANPKQEKK